MFKLTAKINLGTFSITILYFKHKQKKQVEKEMKWWMKRFPEFKWRISQ